MGSNLLNALRLGGVRRPVPHDRVDDLQPLSRQRLERLAVRHAPLSAPGVAAAPFPSVRVKQLHENMGRFFSLLFPWRLRPAVSYQSSGAASAPGGNTPPGASTGQGQTAIWRRPIGGASGLARIVGNAPNARPRNLSMVYFEL